MTDRKWFTNNRYNFKVQKGITNISFRRTVVEKANINPKGLSTGIDS